MLGVRCCSSASWCTLVTSSCASQRSGLASRHSTRSACSAQPSRRREPLRSSLRGRSTRRPSTSAACRARSMHGSSASIMASRTSASASRAPNAEDRPQARRHARRRSRSPLLRSGTRPRMVIHHHARSLPTRIPWRSRPKVSSPTCAHALRRVSPQHRARGRARLRLSSCRRTHGSTTASPPMTK